MISFFDKKISLLIFSFLCLIFCGCTSPNYVKDSVDQDSISALRMSCKKPYELTQDCSSFFGAKRKIRIRDVDVKISGNDGGTIVFLMSAKSKNIKGSSNLKINIAYELVKRELIKNDVTIIRVRPVQDIGFLIGYVIEADSNAYAILKELSIDKTKKSKF
ncbi:hypothetical protein KFE80_06945 [bacterium SCSIO 12696]|nr:hypothetical protein KFE80_06945 [bacterium SCSIO 12696]